MSQLYESHNDLFTLLPVKIYKHNLKGNFIYSPLHWHRSIEITITLTGNIQFNAGTNNFYCSESDWLIFNSCELHSCRCISPSDIFLGISIVISLPFIEKWLGKKLFFYNPELPHVSMRLKAIATELFYMDEASNNYPLILMSKVYEILHLIAENCIKQDCTYSVFAEKNITIAAEFTDYIEQHYQENLTLNNVAEYFKYSPSYFSRLFKETLGVNFLSYLNFVRVSHAAQELGNGHQNLSKCAFNNGFPNTKSFINTFKKLYGCTPSLFLSSINDEN